jgi:type I restriction enzyme S subunit
MKKKSKNLEVRSEKEDQNSSFSIPNSNFSIPKLRFPEFRETEGWTSEPMGEVYSFKGNNSLSRDKLNYVAGSVKNIHYGDIHTKFSTHFDITKELVPFINESEEGVVRDENLCAEGDMIFADASENMADIGKCIEITSLNGERVVSGLHTILARRIGDRIALGFGGNLFKSGWVRTQIQKEAQGAKVLGISANRMRNLRLPLPYAEAEQQKIAECLSSVDELIAAQARKVDALKTHKKGLMQQLFPREGETQPRLRFPEFQNAGEWEVRTIGEMFSLINGCAFKPEDWQPSGTPIIRIQNLNDPSAEFNYSLDPVPERNRVEPGDLLFAWSGTLGSSFGARIWNGPSGVLNQHIFKVLMDEQQITLQFALLVLARVEEEIARRTHGFKASFVHVKKSDLVQVEMLLPSIPEQQRIATCLSSLGTLITAETQKHEALKTHKKALMQQLFPSPEEVAA